MPRPNLIALLCLPASSPEPGRQRRRRRERRSLAGLLAGLALFALASAAVYLLLHTRLARWRDPFYAERIDCLCRRVDGPGPPRTVVLLGSSRTHYGVRAGPLEQQLRAGQPGPVVAFNLAKPGGGPVMVLYSWLRLRQAGARPDLLLVEASTFLLTESSATSDTSEAALPGTTLSPDDLPFIKRYVPERLPDLRREWWTARAAPCLGYRQALLGGALPRLLPPKGRHQPVPMINDSGDGTDWFTPPGEARLRATRLSVAAVADYLRQPVPAERPARALRDLLREARAAGASVVLVLPPESAALRQALPADRVRQAEHFLEEVAREHGAAVVDARGWLPDEDDFADGVHCTRRGAERFTERLGREVILPWLKAGR
jgi:hypothetical protein